MDEKPKLLQLKTTSSSQVPNLNYVPKSFVKKLIESSGQSVNHVKGISTNTDLIPSEYEGGFKVWESTSDLIEFLSSHEATFFDGKKVFDVSFKS